LVALGACAAWHLAAGSTKTTRKAPQPHASPVSVTLKYQLRKILSPLLPRLRDQSPANRLILRSVRNQWKLFTLSMTTGLVGSLSEGATLGVIFLAVGLMMGDSSSNQAGLPSVQGLSWLKPLFEGIGQDSKPLLFGLLLLTAVGFQLLLALSTYVNGVASSYLGARLNREVTGLLNKRILSLSYPCASHYRVGDLLNYASNGGKTVQDQIRLTNDLIVIAMQMLMYLVVLLSISFWLMLVASLLAIVLWLVQANLVPKIRKNARSDQSVEVELSSRIAENIQGLRLLHSSGRRLYAVSQFDGLLAASERIKRYSARLNPIIPALSSFLPIVAIAVIAGLSVSLFAGRSSGVLPNLITFVLALQRLNQRMGRLAGLSTDYAKFSARVDRLNQILSDEGKEFARNGGMAFRSLQQGIVLDHVSLQYGSGSSFALRNIDLTIPCGQKVALVGPSGAGKSSVADLLVGLYDPSSGRILVDGVDLQDFDLSSWQQHLGVVSQDTFLFNASIASNIAYGSPDASREEIVRAAALAQAEGFIRALPEGFDTLIGERGYRLSGGQRQRLSLARALLRQPDVLILDEATSALDSHSERLVQEAIEQFEKGHTLLVIAHRLSTIVNADLICVMEQGEIRERGTHQELMAIRGIYASLWQQQSSPVQVA
jgi:ATP-binding cassette subfamily B protein/subfamily B ATP-binding cassette protein MsbA